MAKGQEIELKLAASPAMLLHLRGHPLLAGEDRELTLVTRYFDTADAALYKANATLRLRNGGAHGEQTFKSSAKGGAGLRRGEWNAPVTGEVPDPAAFPADVRATIEKLLGGAPLKPLAVTRIERSTRRIRFGGSTIEVAFDFGTVEAGRRSQPISELELELIKGNAADLFALAQQLPLGPDLGWSTESKGERGHKLALKLPFSAIRAGNVSLSRKMDVGHGFQVIAWSCLGQLLGNYREVIASGAPNAVHQTRVAIRRLRAAFSLFGDQVADDHSPVFRAEWKAAAAALGPARDLHVMIERIEAAVAQNGSDTEDLLKRLRGKRSAATRAAQTTLAGTAFQHLLVRFAEWLERGMPNSAEPLSQFTEETLNERRRKLVKGKALNRRTDEALHELRIKGKKLRYAAEFFASLYRGEEVREARKAFAKALGEMQDCLGQVHDLAVAHEQRDSLFADLETITGAGLSAQLGELLGEHGPSRKQLIRSAAKALSDVAGAPAWWKSPASSEQEFALQNQNSPMQPVAAD